MQKAHCRDDAASIPKNNQFHNLFTKFFTFPSQYLFTISHQNVFSPGKWDSHVQTKQHEFCFTVIVCKKLNTGLTPF